MDKDLLHHNHKLVSCYAISFLIVLRSKQDGKSNNLHMKIRNESLTFKCFSL